MRTPNLDQVEIVEPPIGELAKKHSGFKRACLSGCGCLVFFIVGIIVGIHFLLGPGPQVLSSVPPSVPSDIPIYDSENIDRITYIPGKYKSRSLEIASLIPRTLISPLLTPLDANNTPTSSNQVTANVADIWSLLANPVDTASDSIRIEWQDDATDPNFMLSYYKTELQKHGYEIYDESTDTTGKQFSFRNASGTTGNLLVKPSPSGTAYAALTINVPSP